MQSRIKELRTKGLQNLTAEEMKEYEGLLTNGTPALVKKQVAINKSGFTPRDNCRYKYLLNLKNSGMLDESDNAEYLALSDLMGEHLTESAPAKVLEVFKTQFNDDTKVLRAVAALKKNTRSREGEYEEWGLKGLPQDMRFFVHKITEAKIMPTIRAAEMGKKTTVNGSEQFTFEFVSGVYNEAADSTTNHQWKIHYEYTPVISGDVEIAEESAKVADDFI